CLMVAQSDWDPMMMATGGTPLAAFPGIKLLPSGPVGLAKEAPEHRQSQAERQGHKTCRLLFTRT
ncbi:hypothetical protein, partial [Klebsiella pneumoniae]|uniref:hypothetical protein n=1 Tax=Klebsiella pneumoniae TaxID=573 RepID=UPI001954133E